MPADRLRARAGVPDRLRAVLHRSAARLREPSVPRTGDRRRDARGAVRHLRHMALLSVVGRAAAALAHARLPRLRADLFAARRVHRHGAPEHLAVPAVRARIAPRDVDPAARRATVVLPRRRSAGAPHASVDVAAVDRRLRRRVLRRGRDRVFADRRPSVDARIDGGRRDDRVARQRRAAARAAHPHAADARLRHLGDVVRAVVDRVHSRQAVESHVVARARGLRGRLLHAELRRRAGADDDPLVRDRLQPAGLDGAARRIDGAHRGRAAGAQAHQSEARAPRDHRSADGRVEPAQVHRADAIGDRARETRRHRVLAARARSRQLQDDQRQLRPSGRRRRAAQFRAPVPRRDSPLRPHRARRRRGIHGAAAAHARRHGERHRRAGADHDRERIVRHRRQAHARDREHRRVAVRARRRHRRRNPERRRQAALSREERGAQSRRRVVDPRQPRDSGAGGTARSAAIRRAPPGSQATARRFAPLPGR
ncbi:putative diguanylate kinase [Burkholderia pseudomallei]|nr:putative diguanylate kinase [Burkholderia pseudomallei]